MDAISSHAQRIVIMTAAQVGKSEILLNTLGYYVHQEPSPILMLQPTLEMGESFSKDRLATMIRDTPVLAERIADPKSRSSGNTLLHKKFPGGQITIAGANSPASLASRPIRVLLCDEVDRYPVSAGSEGDPLSLAMKRTANFWNRKIVWVSTPTIKDVSRIEAAYALTTQEEWCVPCPVCGTPQAYTWEALEYVNHTEPVMKCLHCGRYSNERDWKSGTGAWLAAQERDIRGFHMNAFASPWLSWQDIVNQYTEAYETGEEMLKVWTNTVLGLPYEQKAGVVEIDALRDNRIDYTALPDECLILTCGVDTQDDRLELEVVGWGEGCVSWGVEYRVIYGSPGGSEVWQELDEYLSRTWSRIDGTQLGISCTCIDSAGHFTDAVYRFCKSRSSRRIFAIVGRGMMGLPSASKPSRNNRHRVPLFTLGVTTIKGVLHSRLQAEPNTAGYCYFPRNPKAGYDDTYFAGLLSERMVIRRKKGRDYITWEPRGSHVRNEPLDCRVYAMGAYEILNPDIARHKKREAQHLPSTPPPEQKLKRVSRARLIRRGFSL